MVASDSFADFLREQLAPLGRVTMRRMFGKTGVFCDGVMFGMVTENMLTCASTIKAARPSRRPSPLRPSITKRRERQ